MSGYLAEMRELLDVGRQAPMGSESERLAYQAARTVALASIAESLHRLATALPQGTEDVPGEATGCVAPASSPAEPLPWPAHGGYSPTGNTWLCPEPDCGFGVVGLNSPTENDPDDDPVAEHLAEHEANRTTGGAR